MRHNAPHNHVASAFCKLSRTSLPNKLLHLGSTGGLAVLCCCCVAASDTPPYPRPPCLPIPPSLPPSPLLPLLSNALCVVMSDLAVLANP